MDKNYDLATEAQNMHGRGTNNGPLDHLREEIGRIAWSEDRLRQEMNKVRIICEPPPVTPPCHPVEIPPDPSAVQSSFQTLSSAERDLKKSLDELRTNDPPDSLFQRDLRKMDQETKSMDLEITALHELINPMPKSGYDKEAVTKRTEIIDKIAVEMEKTRRQMLSDLGK